VHFVAEHADEPLPGAALFFAQGATEIGEHEQFVRQTAFAKCAAANAPSARAAGKTQSKRSVFIRFKTDRETEIAGASSQQFVNRLAEQMFPSTIDQAQTAVGIKSENGDLDLGHDRAQ